MLISVWDDVDDFVYPEYMICAPVQAPFRVDTSDCEGVTVNDPLTDLVMEDSQLHDE